MKNYGHLGEDDYGYDNTAVFICLDSRVLCNLSKNRWVAINSHWAMGPRSLFNGIPPNNARLSYVMDKCDNKPDLSNEFLEFALENLEERFKGDFDFLKDYNGLVTYVQDEDKFINSLRVQLCELFLKMEIFVCDDRWDDNKGVVLKFKDKDVLIANYKKETVDENIRRVLNKE